MTDRELSKILDELRRIGSHLDECNIILARAQSGLNYEPEAQTAQERAVEQALALLFFRLDDCNRQLKESMDEVYNATNDNILTPFYDSYD